MLIAETQEFVKKANRFNYLNLLSISVLPPLSQASRYSASIGNCIASIIY